MKSLYVSMLIAALPFLPMISRYVWRITANERWVLALIASMAVGAIAWTPWHG